MQLSGILLSFFQHPSSRFYHSQSSVCSLEHIPLALYLVRSGRRQEGSILWANCTRLACFSGVFSRKCLPVNWNGCGECGGGSRDRQGGHGDRMTTCPHRLQLQTSWTGGHLDREDGNSERQVLGKSCSHYPITRGRETLVDLTDKTMHPLTPIISINC